MTNFTVKLPRFVDPWGSPVQSVLTGNVKIENGSLRGTHVAIDVNVLQANENGSYDVIDHYHVDDTTSEICRTLSNQLGRDISNMVIASHRGFVSNPFASVIYDHHKGLLALHPPLHEVDTTHAAIRRLDDTGPIPASTIRLDFSADKFNDLIVSHAWLNLVHELGDEPTSLNLGNHVAEIEVRIENEMKAFQQLPEFQHLKAELENNESPTP